MLKICRWIFRQKTTVANSGKSYCARKNNVFLKKSHFRQSETDISASRNVPNYRAQNVRFVWVLDSYHWSMLAGFFFLSFQSRRFSVDFFLLEMGMQIHISPLPALHIRGEDLWSLNTTSWGWSLWQHSMRHRLFQCGNWFLQPCVHASTAWPFQQCIQRCSTTRHLCRRSNM